MQVQMFTSVVISYNVVFIDILIKNNERTHYPIKSSHNLYPLHLYLLFQSFWLMHFHNIFPASDLVIPSK